MVTSNAASNTKGPLVSELRSGERIVGFYFVRQKQLEPFRDRERGEYLALVLSDKSGQIPARVWENAPAMAGTFEAGAVVKVAADVEEYNGRLQLIVHRLRPAEEGEADLMEFLPSTDRDVEAMLGLLQENVKDISDAGIATLVKTFYEDQGFVDRLRRGPASRRMHHAYLGGALEHVYEMLTLAEPLLALYPAINADVLRAGILLRAVGLLRGYGVTTDIDYTDAGRLIGDVALGDEEITRAMLAVPELPAEMCLRLRHMLISHRGRAEWGAPRVPQTLEALALHHLESTSVQMNRFKQLIENRRDPNQPWTTFDRLLGRTLFAGYDGEADRSLDDGDDG